MNKKIIAILMGISSAVTLLVHEVRQIHQEIRINHKQEIMMEQKHHQQEMKYLQRIMEQTK